MDETNDEPARADTVHVGPAWRFPEAIAGQCWSGPGASLTSADASGWCVLMLDGWWWGAGGAVLHPEQGRSQPCGYCHATVTVRSDVNPRDAGWSCGYRERWSTGWGGLRVRSTGATHRGSARSSLCCTRPAAWSGHQGRWARLARSSLGCASITTTWWMGAITNQHRKGFCVREVRVRRYRFALWWEGPGDA
jgi:hypothetical protein